MIKASRYNKFYAAVITAVQTGLLEYYGTERWTPVVTLALGAALVYLVPNSPTGPDHFAWSGQDLATDEHAFPSRTKVKE